MTNELHIPELPENEAKRIGQLMIEMLKRKKFRKCSAVGIHSGIVVQGHLAPRPWLRAIAKSDEVYVFAPYSPNTAFISGDEIEMPVREHINNALTRYFTCEEHEKMFFPVDRFEPDLSNLKNIHLVLYRSILAQLWLEDLVRRAFRRVSEESPEDEMYAAMARVHAEHVLGLRHYKKEAERCLDPERCRRCRGGPCSVIGYQSRHIRGKPGIAASQFSSGARLNRRNYSEYERHLEMVASCGITVLPTTQGHTFLYHYFLEEQQLIQTELDHIATIHGRKLEAYISAILLSDCENIAISPLFWDDLSKRRQQAIRNRFKKNCLISALALKK